MVALDVQPLPRVHPAKAGLEQFERYVWIANAKALHVVRGCTVGLRPRRHFRHITHGSRVAKDHYRCPWPAFRFT